MADNEKNPEELPVYGISYIRKVLFLLLLLSIAIVFYIAIINTTSGINTLSTITGYTPVNLTPAEKAWIAEHPVIRVCPDVNYPPFEMVSPDGQYTGISADLLYEISKNTGLTLEVVHESDWNNCIERIKNSSADVLGAVYISPFREEYLIYSEPYYHPLLPIITRNDVHNDLTIHDLSGKRVASVSGYTTTLLLKQKYPDIKIVEVPDIRTGLDKVSFGGVDAYLGDLAPSSWYVDQEGYSNLQISGIFKPDSIDDFWYAFGIRKDYPELVMILNKGMHAIPEDKREEIFRRWISPSLSRPVIDSVYIHITAGIVGLLLLVSLLFLVWNRTLKNVVHAKTEALTRELEEHRKTARMLMMTRQTMDHSRAMILWLDEEGIIQDLNETTCKKTGLSRKEIIGKNLEYFDKRYLPEELKELLEKVREEKYFRKELTVFVNKEKRIPAEVFLWYITFEGTGTYCIEILDISERYANEQIIRESEQKYRDLFQNVNDAIFLFKISDDNKPGDILEANGVAEKMTGYSRDELCMVSYSSLGTVFLPDEPVLEISGCKSCQCTRDWEIITKSGNNLPVEENLHVFERNGMQFGLSLLRDISERKNHEEERTAAIGQIQKNMAELSTLNDGIRNPLTVILSLVETGCPALFEKIETQVNLIDETINKLDKRWNESDKILSYLKKHHDIEIKKGK